MVDFSKTTRIASFILLKCMMKEQYTIPERVKSVHQSQTREGWCVFGRLLLLCVLYGSQKQRVPSVPRAIACHGFHLLDRDGQ